MLQIPNLTETNITTSEGSDLNTNSIFKLVINIIFKKKENAFSILILIGIERKQVSGSQINVEDGYVPVRYGYRLKIDY